MLCVWYSKTRFNLDGERIHERVLNLRFGTSSPTKLKEILGNRLVVKTNKETKSRYYHLIYQNKKEKKQLEKNILVKSLPFPKGDNKRYDMNVNGSFHSLNDDKANEETKVDLSRQMSILDFL